MNKSGRGRKVQGESARAEACPAGGYHVLLRPVQKYCDQCRPKKEQEAMLRQRRWREKKRADKYGVVPVVHADERDSTIALERRILATVAALQAQTDQLQNEYRRPGRAKTATDIGNAARLARDVLTVELDAGFLRSDVPAAGVPDELAPRRGGRSA